MMIFISIVPDTRLTHRILPMGQNSFRLETMFGCHTHIIVLPGVTIGNYAVIGTGALVSNDVPDYGVAVGNPAKVVKERARIKYTYIPSHF